MKGSFNMNIFEIALFIVPIALLALSVFLAVKKFSKSKSSKKALGINLATFGLIVLLIAAVCVPVLAANNDTAPVAQTTAAVADTDAAANVPAEPESAGGSSATGMAYIAMALVVGLAGIGGGVAIAAAAPAAIGATSEDPKAFGKALIFVALGEAIALYGVIVAILIYTKI